MIRVSLAALAAVVLSTGVAAAAVVYDTSLASPNGNPADPGLTTSASNSSWYAGGNGNPQGGFTVATASGIELGLRAKLRSSTTTYDSPDGTYVFSTGVAGGRALWNYDFSIDLRPGGTGSGLTFHDLVNATLTVTDNVTGFTSTVAALTHWTDDNGYGTTAGNTMTAKHTPQLSTDWSAQNSENMIFPDAPLAGDFNPWAAGSYTMVLSVTLPGNQTVSDTITVDTIPEPTTLALLGAGFLGVLGLRRRRGAGPSPEPAAA